ncbi:MAG: hypothetical protein HQK56_16715 [Deltaproteobacteria bacterium]|nr:hypothetical protein [Deltaproteobacteria bacterium]
MKKYTFDRDAEFENRLNAMTKDQLEQGILKQLDYLQGLGHLIYVAAFEEEHLNLAISEPVLKDMNDRIDETCGMYARYIHGDWNQPATPAEG